jgi:formylglycine-generating enzyme required for sulfatase activity
MRLRVTVLVACGMASVVLAQVPKAGATRVNPKDGLTYVWIPPGKFTMGCSPGDSECDGDEKPAHQVTITKGFWIGQTEVTQAAYERVIGSNPSLFKGPSLPVAQIIWDEAQSYCRAVGMRLPTEAEWEYAARGGSTASRYGALDSVAWYNHNSGTLAAEGKTPEVAQKQANGFGLYDTLGNVWEWVADWYDASYYGSSPSRDPHGSTRGQYRGLRGGSRIGSPRDVRVSNRFRQVPGLRDLYIGVRCVG